MLGFVIVVLVRYLAFGSLWTLRVRESGLFPQYSWLWGVRGPRTDGFSANGLGISALGDHLQEQGR